MEQFIWEDTAPTVQAKATSASQQDPTPAGSLREVETFPRIVVLSDDLDDPSDSWRRQLISALHDADRESAHARSHPAEPPPILPVEAMRRAPRALVPSRPKRITTPTSVARQPRHRIVWAMFCVSTAAGLLSVVVSRAANTPEMAANAANSQSMITGSLEARGADDKVLKPAKLNAPVLVREGLSPMPEAASTVLPAIETVRTVSIPFESRPQALPPAAPEAPAIDQSVASQPSQQPSPAAAHLPLDRDAVTALAAEPPTLPPKLPAAAPSEPVAHPQPQSNDHGTARRPQISSSYERALPKKKPLAKKQVRAKNQKTASRTRDGQWQANRQGLRSAQPPQAEPSTMVKILKSLNPFASKEESQAQSKAPAPARKESFWWK